MASPASVGISIPAGDETPPGAGGADEDELRRQLREREAEADALRRRLRAFSGSGGFFTTPITTPQHSGGKPLTIVVSMMGIGSAFAEAGFRLPGPLVNVVGRPVLLWLLDRLTVHSQDIVFLVVPAMMERQHGIAKMVSREYPMMNMQVLALPLDTRGWVETMFSVVRRMSARELRMPLVTLDCATIFHSVDVLARIRALPEGTGASVYFDTESASKLAAEGSVATQFSYLKLDAEGFILDIAEKQVISTSANAGAYIFRSAREFRDAAERLLESCAQQDGARSGLYASSLISAMLEDHHRFLGIKVDHKQFQIVGTPAQLQAFIRHVSTGEVSTYRKLRFCFDLDGTLVTEPRVPGDWSTCDPVPRAVGLVRQLHAAGHTIIIVTARGMGGGRGLDAAIAEVGAATFHTLSQFAIPYHELHFGKPSADIYIDTRTLNAQPDIIERDLGWHVEQAHSGGEAIDGAVDARAFNLVRAKGKEHVIKSSASEVLRGECHWYRSIPSGLEHLFPKPLEIVDGDGMMHSSITMAKVSGVTFSHLVTTRLLLRTGLQKLMHALHQIHTQKPPKESPVAAEQKVTGKEMCSNYARKVAKRTAKHSALYSSLGEELGIDTRRMAKVVLGFLEDFEASERARHAYYIHGDPVFSNIIRTADDEVVLIDMRGELGSRLTTQGDVHYDLSKLYQSLCGYDFMLLDQVLDETSSEIFDGLRAAFWEELKKLYPDVSHRDIRLHTASHFFTIVPLHEVRSRMARYLRTSFSMLSVEGLM